VKDSGTTAAAAGDGVASCDENATESTATAAGQAKGSC